MSQKILIADDEPNILISLEFLMKREGFEVVLDSLAMSVGQTRWQSHVQVRQSAATAKADELWTVQADRLDLTPITPLLNALAPLPEGFAKTI